MNRKCDESFGSSYFSDILDVYIGKSFSGCIEFDLFAILLAYVSYQLRDNFG